ncbi:MAG: GEVED domain-containing protein [Saprospiraceae bacterium]
MHLAAPCAVANDDENGLLTVTKIAPGSPLSLCFTATNTFGPPAFLTAWIDRNATVLEAGEQGVNSTVPSGSPFSQCFPVTVPASAVQDQDLGLRVRLNLFAPAGPTGLAIGGEVEDYMIRVVCPDEPCLPAQISR